MLPYTLNTRQRYQGIDPAFTWKPSALGFGFAAWVHAVEMHLSALVQDYERELYSPPRPRLALAVF